MPILARLSLPFTAVWMLLIATLCSASFYLAHSSDSKQLVPLSVGTYWIYKCRARECAGEGWTDDITSTRKETVIDAISGEGIVAALVEERDLQRHVASEQKDEKGNIIARRKSDQVAPARYKIGLVYNNKRFYEVDSDPEQRAADKTLADSWALIKQKIATRCKIDEPDEYQLTMELPATIGSRWDNDAPERTDGWYCWNVENVGTVSADSISKPALPENATFYTLAYKSCPAHEFRNFVPGVGVISFDYHHHGTLSEEVEELVAFHAAGAG